MSNINIYTTGLGGGGAERVIARLAEYLNSKGHHVRIVLFDADQQTYTVADGVEVTLIKYANTNNKYQKFLLQILYLYFYIDRTGHHISFMTRPNITLCIIGYFKQIKVIISERNSSKHNYNDLNLKNFLINKMISKLYKRSSVIITISEGLKYSLHSAYKLPLEKIHTIYNPVDVNRFQHNPGPICCEHDQNLKLITVGRLIEQKNHKLLIDAIDIIVRNTDLKIALDIYGKGPLEKELIEYIDKLSLSEVVRLKGFKKDIEKIYREYDAFVLSSKFEGFGNVILEAMCSGLAVISTDCESGPGEILDGGRYGILSPIDDPHKLAFYIRQLMDSRTLTYYRDAALQRTKDFREEKQFSKYEKIILEK